MKISARKLFCCVKTWINCFNEKWNLNSSASSKGQFSPLRHFSTKLVELERYTESFSRHYQLSPWKMKMEKLFERHLKTILSCFVNICVKTIWSIVRKQWEYPPFLKGISKYTLSKQNKTSDLKKALFRDKTQFSFCLSFMLKMILFQLARFACYLIYEFFTKTKTFCAFFSICNNTEEKSSSAFLCCGLVSLFVSHFAVYGTK